MADPIHTIVNYVNVLTQYILVHTCMNIKNFICLYG